MLKAPPFLPPRARKPPKPESKTHFLAVPARAARK